MVDDDSEKPEGTSYNAESWRKGTWCCFFGIRLGCLCERPIKGKKIKKNLKISTYYYWQGYVKLHTLLLARNGKEEKFRITFSSKWNYLLPFKLTYIRYRGTCSFLTYTKKGKKNHQRVEMKHSISISNLCAQLNGVRCQSSTSPDVLVWLSACIACSFL